jgi:hypothetical protein
LQERSRQQRFEVIKKESRENPTPGVINTSEEFWQWFDKYISDEEDGVGLPNQRLHYFFREQVDARRLQTFEDIDWEGWQALADDVLHWPKNFEVIDEFTFEEKVDNQLAYLIMGTYRVEREKGRQHIVCAEETENFLAWDHMVKECIKWYAEYQRRMKLKDNSTKQALQKVSDQEELMQVIKVRLEFMWAEWLENCQKATFVDRAGNVKGKGSD